MVIMSKHLVNTAMTFERGILLLFGLGEVV